MTSLKNLAAKYASSKIAPMLEYRNYNGIYYIKIYDKWYYIDPSTKDKYHDTYDQIFYYTTTFFETISNMLDNEENIELKKKEKLKDIYEKSDAKLINSIIKQIYDYAKKNIENTAFNDSNKIIQLPVELTDIIYNFVPNDTDMDLIKKIKNKIMLPKNEVIIEVLQMFPHIKNEPEIIEIYYKYVELYSTEKLLNLIRDEVCDEYYEKKSFPQNNDNKFLPISKDDFKILKKYNYLNYVYCFGYDDTSQTIHDSLEQLFYSEIRNIREIKTFVNYQHLKTQPICCGEKTEIQILQKIFEFGCDKRFYKNDWKSDIPELLSNTTNLLTRHDVYMIKQYPVWIKTFLEELYTKLFAMITHFNNLVKYDKKSNSMVERVEKLVKLQNEYQYHNLQKYKNECKNQINKIEKFIK
jgi:hypothetical protein